MSFLRAIQDLRTSEDRPEPSPLVTYALILAVSLLFWIVLIPCLARFGIP